MKYIRLFASMLVVASLATACKDDDVNPGNPTMNVTGDLGSAFFGDTLRFTVKATDNEVPLSTIHADLYYDSEKVYEQVIRTKVSGADYPCAIYIPYFANIPDGQANLILTLQNINFTITENSYNVNVTHADYPYLTFVTDEGEEYTMNRDSQYNYSVSGKFPGEMRGKIKAPAMTDEGEEVVFGYEGSEIKVNGSSSIPFSNGTAGFYTISFNTFSFEGAPFLSFTLNGQEFTPNGDDTFYLDMNLTKGSILTPDGFPNFSDWWINPDWFLNNGDGTMSFNAYDGYYRIIADTKLQYFSVVKLVGGSPATLNDDGTGAVWILGDGIGYPSLANAPGWNPGKGICMAPVGEKTYQVTVVGGRSVDTTSINFKFFGQDGWGTELTGAMLKSQSNLIGVGTGDNGHDSGNLFLEDGVQLEVNGIYVITLDLTQGINDAILTASLQGTQEFEEKPIYLNGVKMTTGDNTLYSVQINMNQNDGIVFTQFSDLYNIYYDPDYFYFDEATGQITFLPVSGWYNITLNKGLGTLSAFMVAEDGSELTLNEDGSGALWLMAWGLGSPSQDYQFGWDPGKAYCMAQVRPGVYQFTGQAGPENGSVFGDRFRYDYLSFKFFWQDGWGGEFGEGALSYVSGATDYIKNTGNYELADGVMLEEGATYRVTVDLSAGVNAGTINFEKL